MSASRDGTRGQKSTPDAQQGAGPQLWLKQLKMGGCLQEVRCKGVALCSSYTSASSLWKILTLKRFFSLRQTLENSDHTVHVGAICPTGGHLTHLKPLWTRTRTGGYSLLRKFYTTRPSELPQRFGSPFPADPQFPRPLPPHHVRSL